VILYYDHKWDSTFNGIWTHNLLVASNLKCPATVQLHHQICECTKYMATDLLARKHFCTLLKAVQNQVNICLIITTNLTVLKNAWRRVHINSLWIWTCNHLVGHLMFLQCQEVQTYCLEHTLIVPNIKNTFPILSCTPSHPQNSLNSPGHGLYKVSKAFPRDDGTCWFQCFPNMLMSTHQLIVPPYTSSYVTKWECTTYNWEKSTWTALQLVIRYGKRVYHPELPDDYGSRPVC
jgi:hypothetical protein